jgi:cellulose synthase/poly-beta-1,6-N-acetylglucosamine synthase-like glycosyltransferase
LLHTYFFYPLLLWLFDAAREFKASVGRQRGDAEAGRVATEWPTVTLVVAAYNEADCIGEKLANSVSLDYPKNRFSIIIGSDGSTDGTDEIVQRFPDPRVRLAAAPRAGKSSVLNRCVPAAEGEIVLLSDANTRISADAVRKLVRHFDDPKVGAVCGSLRLYNPTQQHYEESAYWKYESWLKRYEGKFGAVMGANGGLYAIRRSLYSPLPTSTIVDDFVVALRIVQSGYKVSYDPQATAEEETTEDYGREFKRRARIAAGNFQSLRLLPGLLNPLRGFPAFAFWSHKLLRWCAPAFMVASFVSSLALWQRGFYRWAFMAQLAFYLLALLGPASWLPRKVRKLSSMAFYFVSMNLAIAVGFWRFLRNSQRAAWDRTSRASPSPPLSRVGEQGGVAGKQL